jgi:hypothetical protein
LRRWKAQTGPYALDFDKRNATFFKGRAQLCFGRAVDFVMPSFVVSDRASRDRSLIGKIELRPIEQSASGAA